jgi:D-lactate dehydrogenase (cytochrome)/glycolate oxidase
MKNVAGYDVIKLLVGSWGTLGAITRLTFRLRPQLPDLRVAALATDDRAGLAACALRLRNLSAPPQGLLLQSGPDGLTLWALLSESGVSPAGLVLEETACRDGWQLDWFDRGKIDALDQARESCYHPASPQEWWEGGVAPGLLPELLQTFEPSAHFFAYPHSGAVELFLAEPGPSVPAWVSRQHAVDGTTHNCEDDAWKPIERGIARIFDPFERFPGWKDTKELAHG